MYGLSYLTCYFVNFFCKLNAHIYNILGNCKTLGILLLKKEWSPCK